MGINIEDLRLFPTLTPSLEEQEVIVHILDQIQYKTKHLENIYQQKLAHLDELRKSLLQKAFNGEL